MKRLAMIIVLSTGIIAGPAMADHQGGGLLTRENIGGALGAALGGLAANEIVEGDGQAAATAAGAVGGFLLGKNIAHNYGGSAYRGYSHSTGYRPTSGYRQQPSYTRNYDAGYRHRISPIHETFVAECTSNVRAGPSTRYHVIDRVYNREPVQMIGKVSGRNWYKVRVGHRSGFIYAPLLSPARYDYGGYGGRTAWRR